MRIYRDNCCFGRPFDDQDFTRIFVETQAILFVQEKIKSGVLELATSHILHYENSQCKNEIRKESVADFMKTYSKIHIDMNFGEKVLNLSEKIISTGVKPKDAYHVASAVLAECDYFLSTDDRLLKYKTSEIILLNPVEFIKILEENRYDTSRRFDGARHEVSD
ncbi:MAG: hypothetical protein IKN27_10755 [Selenomonadaceae bacterium]|nr:hypothetical protein [Selenomonadaceae bacterium]